MEDLQKHINEETKRDINALYKHADIANQEMATIKSDVGWIKEVMEKWEIRLEKLDERLWLILGGVVLTILVEILLKFL